jgi:hypothetical protein
MFFPAFIGLNVKLPEKSLPKLVITSFPVPTCPYLIVQTEICCYTTLYQREASYPLKQYKALGNPVVNEMRDKS